MDAEAEDVVVVAEVEALRVLLPVVDDGHGGDVINHLSCLRVEQVVPAVIAPVPAANTKHLEAAPQLLRKSVTNHLCVKGKESCGGSLSSEVSQRLLPPRAGIQESSQGLLCIQFLNQH